MCMENMKLWYLSKRRAARAKGVPPLTFESNGQPITRWSIEGSVGGVGDKTENLFDEKYQFGYYAAADGVYAYATNWVCSVRLFPCDPETKYTLKISMIRSNPSRWWGVVWFDSNKDFISSTNFQPSTPQANITSVMESPPGARFFAINVASRINRPDEIVPSDVLQTMMNVGDTPMPYEQYGYRIPLTCGGETVNIYLDEPLRAGDSITGSPEGIKIMTNNLMPSAAAQTIVKNGMTFSCDGKGRYTITGYNNSHTSVTFSVDLPSFTIPKSVDRHGSGTFSLWNSGVTAFTGFTWVYHMRDNLRITQILAITENITDTSYGSPGDCNGLSIQVPSGFDGSLVLCPQYTDDGVLPAEYTPYDRSIIAAIAIPTASGTNTLSVGTTVQPSSVSVSAEPGMPTPLERYLFSKFIINDE